MASRPETEIKTTWFPVLYELLSHMPFLQKKSAQSLKFVMKDCAPLDSPPANPEESSIEDQTAEGVPVAASACNF